MRKLLWLALAAPMLALSAGNDDATRQLFKQASGIEIIDGLGSTEMIHIFVSHTVECVRRGATGYAIPGYRATVIDDTGQPCAPNVVGRLAVKGPTGCRYLADDGQVFLLAAKRIDHTHYPEDQQQNIQGPGQQGVNERNGQERDDACGDPAEKQHEALLGVEHRELVVLLRDQHDDEADDAKEIREEGEQFPFVRPGWLTRHSAILLFPLPASGVPAIT